MTSQHYSERTAKTDSGLRRPTNRRGIKKRGILPSFGDIVLPIVSVAAVGLLILAGRQFFVNGINTAPGISSTRAYAEAPALIAEREKKQEEENISVAENAPAPSVSLDVAEVTTEVAPEKTDFLAIAEVVAQPQNSPEPAKAAPAKTATTRTATAKTTQSRTTAKKTTPAKSAANTKITVASMSKQWRIQVGAYGSKAGAQAEVDKINKAGYKALVYSNPASKHYKVWVAGGNDKKSATNVVNSMKKLGYKGSFSFPPSK